MKLKEEIDEGLKETHTKTHTHMGGWVYNDSMRVSGSDESGVRRWSSDSSVGMQIGGGSGETGFEVC